MSPVEPSEIKIKELISFFDKKKFDELLRLSDKLLDEYPNLFFDCSLKTKEIKKFLKQFSIKKDYKNQALKINVIGNINILNKRISFNTIKINDDYSATESDLEYFKNTFEDLLFDKDFINIFNYEKIKNFLIEIS